MKVIAEPGIPQIIITREFAAPRELLFRAYTEPELLARWLGPEQLTITVNQLDVRHGGRWRFTHYDADGRGYVFHGLYHGTPTPERIVQTYEFDAQPGHVYLNTITFEQHGATTTLCQNTVFQTVEVRDGYVRSGMETGFSASMAKLDDLVTHLAKESSRE
jgi:uncharacterized protein YndB with AHSA1/START domain